MSIFSKDPGGITFLAVGLGNPDKKYEKTRHNAGFMAVDAIAAAMGVKIDRKKYDALTAEVRVGDTRVLLMKPQTYMNLSGTSVEKAASFYKIPPERILVFSDDVSLEPGKLRIRRKGTHGGHNGLRNIIDYIGSDNFPRVKLGVGKRPDPRFDLADWVLSSFKEEELSALREAAGRCPDILSLVVGGQIDRAMNLYNS